MIIYEDNHLLVINKLPGELVQGDQTRDSTILDKYKSYIKKKYNKPGAVFLHPVHRLDRPVSGCLILARTSKALSRLTMAFKNCKVDKRYHAICSNRHDLEADTLVHNILKDKDRNISRIVSQKKKHGKRAELKYLLCASVSRRHLYEIQPITGRSHQIRVQMAAIGCSIIGDIKYKGAPAENERLIYLHCSSMSFDHPTLKTRMTVTATPDKGVFWREFKAFM